MAVFVYEFLFRGRPPGSGGPPAFHVILGDAQTDAFGRETISLNGPMTPEQAGALGFPLETVIETINADTLEEVGALSARASTLESENGDLRLEVEELKAALAAATPAPPAEPEPDPEPAA
ncbi:hypothetical protein [Enterovirga rhinocerotis]|uniref:Uncharacterized protein n=1 Tax=Enterovirga rhinocerotis TaxID=1339210 RepID=A0A4R7BWK0_9HYPH|nr:hypothetical protein [Enterovirga rhinocerotis]TDR90278.1 hypothetical protein EV668_3124 [Enterovirga rhinocerotis]